MKSQLEKVQQGFKFKTSACENSENNLKNTILKLQHEIKLLQNKVGVNQSQTSIMFEEILKSRDEEMYNNIVGVCDCKKQETFWKEKELKWKKREEDLTLVLEQTREQLQHALETSEDTSEMFPVNLSSPLIENRLGYILRTKEKLWNIMELSYKKDIEGLQEDCVRLETKCEADEKLVSQFESKIKLQQADRIASDNSYEQQLKDLKDKLVNINLELSDAEKNIESLNQDKENMAKECEVKLEKLIMIKKVSPS